MNRDLEKRVEEKTKEIIQSEKKFRNLIENSTDIISLTDKNYKTIYRSPSAERITGFTNEEREKLSETELFHPDDLPKVQMIMKEILKVPHKQFHLTYRHWHKAGHYVWLDGMMTNMLHDETIKGILFNLRDITESKRAEQELQKSQQLLSAIIENSTAVIYVKSLQGQYLLINRRFCELFHLDAEDILGKTDYDFFSKEDADAFRQMDVRTAVADHALTEEEKVPQDDGVHTYISVKSTLRDNTGKPYAIFGISTDITERKKVEDLLLASETRFRSIIEQFPYPVVTYNPDGSYTNANEAWEKMWQYKREDVKGYNIRRDPQMIASGLSIQVEKAFAGEVATSEPYLYDPSLIGHNSPKRWMQMTLYPLKNTDGEIVEVILILLDVTTNKEAEEEIRILNESLEKKVAERTAQLETANKEMEAFTYSVSHDLRAPLRGIVGFTAILEEDYTDKLDKEAKRITAVIKDNTLKMANLIDDLLAFSRMGRQDIIKTKINTDEIVKVIINELTPDNGKTNIEWVIQSLPVIRGDINTIRQVWINLIANAIKYSRNKKHPRIEIGVFDRAEQTIFFIKDNGVGFDEQYKDKLFKVFQRLHSTTEFEGTGVGLALVDKIISKHGGKVWAEGEVGKGACFYFSLPFL